MTRWLAAVAVLALTAGTARADGFVKLGVAIANRPHPAPQASPGADANATPQTPAKAADLLPHKALAREARADLIYHPSTDVEVPPQRGISLGDDRDWKVQAAQVGVMAGAFAALVALCGNGKCMW